MLIRGINMAYVPFDITALMNMILPIIFGVLVLFLVIWIIRGVFGKGT